MAEDVHNSFVLHLQENVVYCFHTTKYDVQTLSLEFAM